MHIRNKLYPYPILAETYKNYDYIDSHFDIIANQEMKKDRLVLRFQPILNNKDLENLIENGSAEFVVHIESVITSYRKLLNVPKNGCSCEILADDIEDVVSVCPFIIAKKDIPNYKNQQFNKVYEGFSFDIEKGNILAIGQEYEFPIEKEMDEYSKLPSIFVVTPIKDEKEKDMKINIGGDRINIQLPLKSYAQFNKSKLNDAYAPIVHSMLIIPALLKCFEELKSKAYQGMYWEISSRRWYRVIEKALKKHNIELSEDTIHQIDSFEKAQLLFEDTINRGLMNLFNLDLQTEEE